MIIYKTRSNILGDNLQEGMSKPTDLVQGTLDLLILKTLAPEPMHGWAIANRIKQLSDFTQSALGRAVGCWTELSRREKVRLRAWSA